MTVFNLSNAEHSSLLGVGKKKICGVCVNKLTTIIPGVQQRKAVINDTLFEAKNDTTKLVDGIAHRWLQLLLECLTY